MSEQQKKSAKILGLVLALLGAGGAAVEGYTPDLETIEKLGTLGGVIVAAYLHVYIRPHLVIISRWCESQWAPVQQQPDDPVPTTEAAAAHPPRRNTHPALRAVRDGDT